MSKPGKLHVGCSPLSKTIYAGSLGGREGNTWLGNRTDVTTEALVAVAEHIGAGHVLTLEADGRPTIEIEVRQKPARAALTEEPPHAE